MTLCCDRCAVLIETDNRRWPGFCSAACRNRDRADRDARAAARAASRRDAAQQQDWLRRSRTAHHLS